MIRRAAVGIAVALVVAACNGTPVEEVPDETAAGSTTSMATTTVAVQTSSSATAPSTTRPEPAFTVADGPLTDWGSALCQDPNDSELLMTLADDLVVWSQDGEPASPEATLGAAQVVWEKARELCPSRFSDETLSTGPPTKYIHPPCIAPTPTSLPWTDEVGEPATQTTTDGVVETTWVGPAYHGDAHHEMTILVGSGETYLQAVDVGERVGEVDGADAYIIGYDGTDTSAVELGWATSGRWCDAYVVRLAPATGMPDLVEYIEAAIFPGHGTAVTPGDSSDGVLVAFGHGDGARCGDVKTYSRDLADGSDPITVAFELLVAGPLPAEVVDGAHSFFTKATAGSVRSATLDDGLLTVDFEDFSLLIGNASTSCGSESLLAQLNTTAFQFSEFDRVQYTFEGDCGAFYGFLQRECQEHSRP
ncbi:MAG: GerMN domain-containing protein [Actinomycetota bacterium]